MNERSRLAVRIDGAPMGDEEARALWTRFSAYMDENRGDFGGFAHQNGWAVVTPEYEKGQAVLLVSTTVAEAAKLVKAPPPASKKKKRPRAKRKAAQSKRGE